MPFIKRSWFIIVQTSLNIAACRGEFQQLPGLQVIFSSGILVLCSQQAPGKGGKFSAPCCCEQVCEAQAGVSCRREKSGLGLWDFHGFGAPFTAWKSSSLFSTGLSWISYPQKPDLPRPAAWRVQKNTFSVRTRSSADPGDKLEHRHTLVPLKYLGMKRWNRNLVQFSKSLRCLTHETIS